MLKNIIILVVLAGGILAFTLLYKQSSFELTLDSLILKGQKSGMVFPYQKIKRDVQNFSNVHVTQYTLASADEQIIYEVANIEGLYEFNENPKTIITKLLDVRSSKSLFEYRGLEALQLNLSDGSKLNLFIVQTDSKKIEFLYGLSDKLFSKSVEQLSGRSVDAIGAMVLTEPLTKWSIEVNDIDGIIGSIDY